MQVLGNSVPGCRKEVCQKKRLLSMLGHTDDPKILLTHLACSVDLSLPSLALKPALERTMVQNSQYPFHRFSCWSKAVVPAYNTHSGCIPLVKPVHTKTLPDVCQGDERYLGYLASLTLTAGRPHLQAPCWCFVHTN